MNNKFETTIMQDIQKSWSDFVAHYDLGALPAFLIFLIVVTLGMILNYLSMRAAIGPTAAMLVSGLFEFGILGWKWTSSRKRNNDKQNSLVNAATWLSVLLAVGMLVINLFRTTIEQSLKAELAPGATFNGWQIAAYITIGFAALVHIVFYLLFDQNDTDKEYARQNKRSQNEISQRSRQADDLIANAEADLNIIEKITVELEKLRVKFKSLPHAQLETVLENARQALLVQYKASALVDAATAALPDIDHSGSVGDDPVSRRPAVWVPDEEEFQRLKEKYPEVPGTFVPDDEDFKDATPPTQEPYYQPVHLEPEVESNNGNKPPFK
jgi:uncharacterized membrane protein YiaA